MITNVTCSDISNHFAKASRSKPQWQPDVLYRSPQTLLPLRNENGDRARTS